MAKIKPIPIPIPPDPPPATDASLGARITRLRDAAGLSLEEVSQASGISVEEWQNFEAGQWSPLLAALWPIATALGVTPTDLIAWEQ